MKRELRRSAMRLIPFGWWPTIAFSWQLWVFWLGTRHSFTGCGKTLCQRTGGPFKRSLSGVFVSLPSRKIWVPHPCPRSLRTGWDRNGMEAPRFKPVPHPAFFWRGGSFSIHYPLSTTPTFLSTRLTFFGDIASFCATREIFFPSRCHTLGITISANSSVIC